jgi:hypothetical protein
MQTKSANTFQAVCLAVIHSDTIKGGMAMEQQKDEPARNICPACGAAFTCGMEAGLAECWCASLPPVLAVPEAHVGRCYCQACLRQRIEATLTPPG